MTEQDTRHRNNIYIGEDGKNYREDTHEETDEPSRPCAHCKLPNRRDGHDACIGELPSGVVMNACCGHGGTGYSKPYVQYWHGDGERIEEIPRLIDRLKNAQTFRNGDGFDYPMNEKGEPVNCFGNPVPVMTPEEYAAAYNTGKPIPREIVTPETVKTSDLLEIVDAEIDVMDARLDRIHSEDESAYFDKDKPREEGQFDGRLRAFLLFRQLLVDEEFREYAAAKLTK